MIIDIYLFLQNVNCENGKKSETLLSLRWGLNPRPFAYEANALPLSYQGAQSVGVF